MTNLDQSPEATRGEVAAPASDIDGVLRAFHLLQVKNAQVTSLVASRLSVGVPELRLLLYIANGEGITPKKAADFLKLTSGSITNLVDRMVAAALIHRLPHPGDRRSLTLELSPAGAAAVEGIIDFYRRAFSTAIGDEHAVLIATIFDALGDSLARTAVHDLRPASAEAP